MHIDLDFCVFETWSNLHTSRGACASWETAIDMSENANVWLSPSIIGFLGSNKQIAVLLGVSRGAEITLFTFKVQLESPLIPLNDSSVMM